MDQLAQNSYQTKNTYFYKGKIEVAPLEMVDDILVPTRCGIDSLTLNSKVNHFIESKNLKLSKAKCHKMHIGKVSGSCPTLKVHGDDMVESNQEKYLGDILLNNGKVDKTVEDRRSKGFGLVSQILAILSEVPLGKFKIQMGLHLRQAMLINGMMYNSEAWHCLSETHIKQLAEVDTHFMRSLFKSHSKTSIEFLHLETGTLPLKFIISSRRLNYLHNILKRQENEMLLKVFKAQEENPLQGDFVTLVKDDFKLIDVPYDENRIKSMSKKQFKIFVKKKIREAAFKYLMFAKKDKSKIKDLKYRKLESQKYLSSKLFSNYEVELLSKLRSRNLDLKSNFKTKFTFNNVTDLKCSLNGCDEVEDQPHIMKCKQILDNLDETYEVSDICYEDIFSKSKKQNRVTKLYVALLDVRSKLLQKQQELQQQL